MDFEGTVALDDCRWEVEGEVLMLMEEEKERKEGNDVNMGGKLAWV